MRIVIFGHEAHLEDLEEQVPQGKFLMSASIEEIKNFILGDELTFLIIDIDDVEGLGVQLNSDYLSFSSVKRIVCSGHFSAIDFKKHQISEEAADGYLKKPLGVQDVLDLIEDFSHFYEEIHQAVPSSKEGTTDQEEVEEEKQPFESKLNDQIQEKFDYVFKEKVQEEKAEEEISIPPIEEELPPEIEEESPKDELPLEADEETQEDELPPEIEDESPKDELPLEVDEEDELPPEIEDELPPEIDEEPQDDELPPEIEEESKETGPELALVEDENMETTPEEGLKFSTIVEDGPDELSLDSDEQEGTLEDEKDHEKELSEDNSEIALEAHNDEESEELHVESNDEVDLSEDTQSLEESDDDGVLEFGGMEEAEKYPDEEDMAFPDGVDSEFPAEQELVQEEDKLEEDDELGETTDPMLEETLSGELEELDELEELPQSEPPQEISPLPKGESFSDFPDDELLRFKATVRELRIEREELLGSIDKLEADEAVLRQKNLSQKAEIEELKIELEVLKQRHYKELEETKTALSLGNRQKSIIEEKAKHYKAELEEVNQKFRVNFSQVRRREQELESKLELISMDSASQLKTRDEKILDLKRKIDSLEFNMESLESSEKKSKTQTKKLEKKLAQIMSTLANSLDKFQDEDDSLSKSKIGSDDF